MSKLQSRASTRATTDVTLAIANCYSCLFNTRDRLAVLIISSTSVSDDVVSDLCIAALVKFEKYWLQQVTRAGGRVVTHLPLTPMARVQLPDVALSRMTLPSIPSGSVN